MADEREHCDSCGGITVSRSFTEEVEIGKPLNRGSRGAVAPSYRTETIEITEVECLACGAVDVREEILDPAR